jgi:ribA/ribD-fused uncharacterized protein
MHTQKIVIVADESDIKWKEIAVHNEEMISGFFGEYRFLSNFWPASVFYENVIYPTSENAFQAAKFAHHDRVVFEHYSPGDAKRHAQDPHRLYVGEAWRSVKLDVMEKILRQKFSSRNKELMQALLHTGDRKLVEANWWGDDFWGVSIPNPLAIPHGENHLGRLLMKIRAELQGR